MMVMLAHCYYICIMMPFLKSKLMQEKILKVWGFVLVSGTQTLPLYWHSHALEKRSGENSVLSVWNTSVTTNINYSSPPYHSCFYTPDRPTAWQVGNLI